MLYTDVNEFGWSVDNIGTTYTNTALGTSLTTGAANTKGSAVSLIAGASVTEDCYEILIFFTNGHSTATRREYLFDLLIDEAGGTSWSTKINNLIACGPTSAAAGLWTYRFPLFFKAGTSIGIQGQCNAATISPRASVKLWGKPSHPHLLKYGHKVETIGADTTNTKGVDLTAGASNTKGDWASLGTTSQDNWYWQLGPSVSDTAIATHGSKFFDLAAGDATNKVMCIEDTVLVTNDVEYFGRSHNGPAIRHVPSGQTVYARVAENFADTGLSAVAYGVS